jgi:hypothetical protein
MDMNNRYSRKMSFKAARKARAIDNSNYGAKSSKMLRKDKKEVMRQIRENSY